MVEATSGYRFEGYSKQCDWKNMHAVIYVDGKRVEIPVKEAKFS